MESTSVLNNSLFASKYPELFFLLAYGDIQACPLSLDTGKWILDEKISLVDTLCVIGIGNGAYYPHLKSWFSKGKKLLILEKHLEAIQGFLASSYAEEMVSSPYVHIVWIGKEGALEELIFNHSSGKIAVLEGETEDFESIRLELLRKTTIDDALLTESLYAHQLNRNVIANLKRWPKSFFANALKGKFQGIPAVICGAGPSLDVETLKEATDKALILAGGSAIAALANQGLVPHFGIALDPNPEEYQRFVACPPLEIPFIYGTRLEPRVFSTFNGPIGYLHSFTGGAAEHYFEKLFSLDQDPVGIDLGQEALSVTTLALAFAVHLGCSPIFLNGVDLAYTGLERYAKGVLLTSRILLEDLEQEMRVSEQFLEKIGVSGKRVYTQIKWVMESECIGAFAKKYPETSFFNTSSEGLGFPGIDNLSLKEAFSAYAEHSFDISGYVHKCIIQCKIDASQEEIEEKLHLMHESFQRLKTLCGKILELLKHSQKEGLAYPLGQMTLLEMDIEEEEAFKCFLPQIGPAINRLLDRSFSREEGCRLERQIAKWVHLEEITTHYLQFI